MSNSNIKKIKKKRTFATGKCLHPQPHYSRRHRAISFYSRHRIFFSGMKIAVYFPSNVEPNRRSGRYCYLISTSPTVKKHATIGPILDTMCRKRKPPPPRKYRVHHSPTLSFLFFCNHLRSRSHLIRPLRCRRTHLNRWNEEEAPVSGRRWVRCPMYRSTDIIRPSHHSPSSQAVASRSVLPSGCE